MMIVANGHGTVLIQHSQNEERRWEQRLLSGRDVKGF